MFAITGQISRRSTVNSQFYLCKGSKTVGPCTLDDLQTFLAYGSVGDGDLVKRAGDADWTPLRQLHELTPDTPMETPLPPRRVARYRDYEKVPDTERAGWVLRRLIVGFLIFPPHLWQGTLALFQNRIYSNRTDENGYLTLWPRKVEFLALAMLLVNTVVWWLTLLWLTDHTRPVIRELVMLFRTGMLDLQDWLGK